MFRKLFSPKNKYKTSVTIFGFIISLIVIFSFNSEKTLSQDINLSPPDQYKLGANLTVSEKVMKMEQRLEKEFEVYFDRNLSEASKNGDDIAQKLLEISQKSNIRPAVFWAVPESVGHALQRAPNPLPKT